MELSNSSGVSPRWSDNRRPHSLTEDCARKICESIQSLGLAPGARLPSETDLAAQMGVSRATLREALRTLETQQRIVRRHGLGAFVAEPAIEKDLHKNSGITAMIRAAGHVPTTAEQRISVGQAPQDIAGLLELDPTSLVVTLERLRLADKRPVALSREVIATQFMDPGDLDMLDEGHPSLYRLLYKRCGVTVYRGQADLVPVKATAHMAQKLEVSRGAPLLCIKQVDFDGHGRPVIYSVEHHVSDWVRFRVERIGPGSAVDD